MTNSQLNQEIMVGDALYANRVVILPTPGGVRITFMEQMLGDDGEPIIQFRTAAFVEWDVVEQLKGLFENTVGQHAKPVPEKAAAPRRSSRSGRAH